MNSLNNKKGNDPGYLWSGLKTSTSCVARKIKTISLGVPFFFQYFAFLLPICLLCVIAVGRIIVKRINVVS